MKWFDKLTGKKEKVTQTPEDELNELETNRRAALELEKQEATRLGEPWVAVLDTQINPDNIKNGFFELDWNNQFIEELLDAGYSGETNEQIVDSWFRTIAMQILGDEGLETAREMGYINVVPIDKTKSEVS
jgi:hypothetical protein|tara:strand:- start:246 stop:638 length:393 start_codon:yes stop_codon:yes gene_type:complete